MFAIPIFVCFTVRPANEKMVRIHLGVEQCRPACKDVESPTISRSVRIHAGIRQRCRAHDVKSPADISCFVPRNCAAFKVSHSVIIDKNATTPVIPVNLTTLPLAIRTCRSSCDAQPNQLGRPIRLYLKDPKPILEGFEYGPCSIWVPAPIVAPERGSGFGRRRIVSL